MRTRLVEAAFTVVALACPALSGAQSITLLPGQPREIPFQLTSGYLVVVEGNIGDSQGFHFIIDTGTTRTCIDRRLAQKLALPLDPHTVFRFGKPVRLNSTHLPALALGPLRAENFTINVADLSHLNVSGIQIDAIVGLDLLESFPFQIDYEQMRISFGSLRTLAESASMEAVPWLPVVSLYVGRFKCRVLVATGARNIVLYSERVKGTSYNLKPMGRQIWADSIGGIVEARRALLQGVSLSERGANEVYLIKAPLNGPLSSTDGILSPVAFGIRQIGFDFDNHIISWTRSGFGQGPD